MDAVNGKKTRLLKIIEALLQKIVKLSDNEKNLLKTTALQSKTESACHEYKLHIKTQLAYNLSKKPLNQLLSLEQ